MPDADEGSALQGVSRVESSAEDSVGRGVEVNRKGESRFTIRDLPADGRCSQVVLDFLSTTDVGRLVPAEEVAGSEVSGWERREREERKAEAEELGAAGELGAGEELPLFLPMPSFMVPADDEE